MRYIGWVFAMAGLFASANAVAEPHYFGFRKPDAGMVVVAFSTNDGTDVGCNVERLDQSGDVVIYSRPSKSSHDFVETFDTATFLAQHSEPGFPRGRASPTYYGKVEIMKLPPGRFRCSASSTPVEFEIRSGKVSYIGSFRYIGLHYARGMRVYSVQHENHAERDLAIAKSVGVDVADASIVGDTGQTLPPPQ